MDDNVPEVRGKRIRIVLDWEGDIAESPTGSGALSLLGTVEDVVFWNDEYPSLIVRLDRPIKVHEGLVAERMLAIGIDMNLVNELFGVPERPPGLPVLVAVYRLKDQSSLRLLIDSKTVPPASEFLGRGMVVQG